MHKPAIKWSGSKRPQAEEIVKYFPDEIGSYYEPFCGGCHVLYALRVSGKSVREYICSDLNEDLINLWKCIQDDYVGVVEHYTELWQELNKDGDIERKKLFFYEIRERYNKERNPLDFMFVSRTTTNGLVRYNSSGDFNNSFHVTRNGIKPGNLKKVFAIWHEVIRDVCFVCCDYRDIVVGHGDFAYLDPPYANTRGMYYGGIELSELWDRIRKQRGGYALSFDGVSGDDNNIYHVPEDLYSSHIMISSGNSSFKRLFGGNNGAEVYESLYFNNH
jgi:DNA adenine methylase